MRRMLPSFHADAAPAASLGIVAEKSRWPARKMRVGSLATGSWPISSASISTSWPSRSPCRASPGDDEYAAPARTAPVARKLAVLERRLELVDGGKSNHVDQRAQRTRRRLAWFACRCRSCRPGCTVRPGQSRVTLPRTCTRCRSLATGEKRNSCEIGTDGTEKGSRGAAWITLNSRSEGKKACKPTICRLG